jgi:predicted site-specific integrase-resolvase
MYAIHNAARVLGVSERTVRRWIAEDNIETTVIETDRKRIYLAYTEVLALADKHKPLKVQGPDQEKNYPDLTGLYSIEHTARLLGVKYKTVQRWISKAKIEKKIIITDQRRSYISYSGLVTLADKYNRPIAYDKHKEGQASSEQEDSDSQERRSYTVSDAAIFLGVAEETVREWLSQHNIERQSKENDRNRIYISRSDLFTLASKHKNAAARAANITYNIREIRYRLEQIEAGIQKLERYIKRSIYIGKPGERP